MCSVGMCQVIQSISDHHGGTSTSSAMFKSVMDRQLVSTCIEISGSYEITINSSLSTEMLINAAIDVSIEPHQNS